MRRDADVSQAFRPDVRLQGLLALQVDPELLVGRQSACPASDRPRRPDEDADKSVAQGRSPELFWPAAHPVPADGVRRLPAQPDDQDAVPGLKAVAQGGSPGLGEMKALEAAAAAASPPVAWEPQGLHPSPEAVVRRRPESAAAAALREQHDAQAAQDGPANGAESSEYRVGPAWPLEQPEPRALAAGR